MRKARTRARPRSRSFSPSPAPRPGHERDHAATSRWTCCLPARAGTPPAGLDRPDRALRRPDAALRSVTPRPPRGTSSPRRSGPGTRRRCGRAAEAGRARSAGQLRRAARLRQDARRTSSSARAGAPAEDRGLLMELARGAGAHRRDRRAGYRRVLASRSPGKQFVPSAQTEAFLATQISTSRRSGATAGGSSPTSTRTSPGSTRTYKEVGYPLPAWTRTDVSAMVALLGPRFGAGGGDEARRAEFYSALKPARRRRSARQVLQRSAQPERQRVTRHDREGVPVRADRQRQPAMRSSTTAASGRRHRTALLRSRARADVERASSLPASGRRRASR